MPNNYSQITGNKGCELKRIRCVQFGLLAPDDVRNFSVAEIKTHEKFDSRGQPKTAGLMDAKLGVPPRASYKCQTCQGTDVTCPGHFGHIELVSPVYHVGFLPLLQKILSCVCHKCGMLMSDENDIKFREAIRHKHPQRRLGLLVNICRGKRKCTHKGSDEVDHGCGQVHPTVLKSGLNFKVKFPTPSAKKEEEEVPQDPDQMGERELYAEEALEILRRISDEDCEKLGLDPRSAPGSLRPFAALERHGQR
jgi:DNA-directed RNA polymerase II subunit RPB1